MQHVNDKRTNGLINRQLVMAHFEILGNYRKMYPFSKTVCMYVLSREAATLFFSFLSWSATTSQFSSPITSRKAQCEPERELEGEPGDEPGDEPGGEPRGEPNTLIPSNCFATIQMMSQWWKILPFEHVLQFIVAENFVFNLKKSRVLFCKWKFFCP